MRQIKFRAWVNDLDGGHMIPSDSEGYTMISNGDGFCVVSPDNKWLKDDEFTVMQYTGLKDKAGNDIYEGDIFEDVFVETNKGIVTYGEYTHCFDDKRLSDFGAHVGFYVKFNVTQPRKDLKYWAKYSQVLGNIYEHPHLL